MATVRGIGVAVMTSTCGGRLPLARSASRCSTPKRCCSSTTTRPRSAKSTPSCSSAWVPTTIPARAARDVGARLAPGRAPSEPVSSATRVPSGRRPARRPGRAGRAARGCPGVLRGQHLGRRQQRGLAAGVDDLQHRAQRHDGLARADLALQQPVHRLLAASSAASSSPTSRWPSVSVERQRRVEGVEQPAAPARPGDAGLEGGRAALAASMSWRTQRLVPLEPVRGRARRRPGSSGRWTSSSAAASASRPCRVRRSSGSGSVTEVAELPLGRRAACAATLDHPAGASLRRRVDRDQRARRSRRRPPASPSSRCIRGGRTASRRGTPRPCRRTCPSAPTVELPCLGLKKTSFIRPAVAVADDDLGERALRRCASAAARRSRPGRAR